MKEENIFEKYLEKEKPAFYKNPKTMIILITLFIGILMIAYFIKFMVIDGISSKDIRESIRVAWVESRWVDKEVTPQEIKIVPAVNLKIENVGKREFQYIDVEVVFEFTDTGEVFDDGLARIYNDKPLKPGEISSPIFIKASFGYSATSRSAFITNKDKWKKMQAKVFVRSKGSTLTRIGNVIPIEQIIEGVDQKLPETEEKPNHYSDPKMQELMESLQIVEQDSLWIDKIYTKREVIIVPSITIDVKNIGKKPIKDAYFKGVFKYSETGEILSEGVTPAFSDPLPPGETGDSIRVAGDFGYSASTKEAFFNNIRDWKPLKVELFVKTKDVDYVLLGIFPINKKIQGVKVVYH